MFNLNNKNEQGEFFEDLAGLGQKPKKRRFSLGKIAFSLSYENLMILAIGLIMLLIVCYSLGVERGKQLAWVTSESLMAEQQPPQEKPETTTPKPQGKSLSIKVAEIQPQTKAAPYIQVATFRTDKYAKIEIGRLRKKGYQPFLLTKGNFREVCVGGYDNKAEAKQALTELRKLYADCILRTK